MPLRTFPLVMHRSDHGPGTHPGNHAYSSRSTRLSLGDSSRLCNPANRMSQVCEPGIREKLQSQVCRPILVQEIISLATQACTKRYNIVEHRYPFGRRRVPQLRICCQTRTTARPKPSFRPLIVLAGTCLVSLVYEASVRCLHAGTADHRPSYGSAHSLKMQRSCFPSPVEAACSSFPRVLIDRSLTLVFPCRCIPRNAPCCFSRNLGCMFGCFSESPRCIRRARIQRHTSSCRPRNRPH
jgi:hypothetical protein